jgi:hypothetical protein
LAISDWRLGLWIRRTRSQIADGQSSIANREFHQTLGDEAGDDLVTWMQQVDAQRAELRELNELNFARFDARVSAAVAELRQEMQVGFAK